MKSFYVGEIYTLLTDQGFDGKHSYLDLLRYISGKKILDIQEAVRYIDFSKRIILAQKPILRRIVPSCRTEYYLGDHFSSPWASAEWLFYNFGLKYEKPICMIQRPRDELFESAFDDIKTRFGAYHELMTGKEYLATLVGEPDFSASAKGEIFIR